MYLLAPRYLRGCLRQVHAPGFPCSLGGSAFKRIAKREVSSLWSTKVLFHRSHHHPPGIRYLRPPPHSGKCVGRDPESNRFLYSLSNEFIVQTVILVVYQDPFSVTLHPSYCNDSLLQLARSIATVDRTPIQLPHYWCAYIPSGGPRAIYSGPRYPICDKRHPIFPVLVGTANSISTA